MEDQSLHGTISQAVINICVPVKLVIFVQELRNKVSEQNTLRSRLSLYSSNDVPLCLLQSYKFLSFVELE